MGWRITEATKLEEAVLKVRADLARKIQVRKGMSVVEMGCGRGGFTVCLAKIVGENGRLLCVDISEEYLTDLRENLEKWDVVHQVTFIKADGAHLERVIDDGFADMSVSYRFLEELKRPEEMAKIIEEMTRIVKENGRVCVIELNTEAKNEAEENYIRLHAESGDSLFSGAEILEAFRKAKLRQIHAETFEAQIWFSPQLAKQDLGLAQVWFTEDEEKRLGARIDKYGMKYPAFLIFSGVK